MKETISPSADKAEQPRAEVDAIMDAARKMRDRAGDADDPRATPSYVFWERFVRELDLLRPPRCPAHGHIECDHCSRISSQYLDGDGDCTGCGYYEATGMHWDTCPGRIRGYVYATRADALAARRSGGVS